MFAKIINSYSRPLKLFTFNFQLSTPQPMEQTKKKMTEKDAYNRLSALCARAEYCVYDIRGKMARWELPEGAEERILKRLIEEKFIDENRYAHAYVRSKFRFNRWGKDKIVRMLKMKGIDTSDIEDALQEIDETESDETLTALLESKMRTVKYKSDYELFTKLLRFAVYRGFSLDAAKRCIEKIIPNS